MAWIVLIFSGFLETVWAVALSQIHGPHKIPAVSVFLAGNILSMVGLSFSMKSISAGTAYAVWTGIGAAGTIIAGFCMGTESFSILKVVFLSGLIFCVAGLKFMCE